jgi:glycosyltransferase involved in cell wall biosynthesis
LSGSNVKASVGRRVLMFLENAHYLQDARVPKEASTLVSAGHKVSVICPGGPGRPWRELLDGVIVYRYPSSPVGDSLVGYLLEYGYAMAATFFLSLFVLVREGFDVIHTHCPPDTFVLIAAFYKLLGKHFVYDHHDLAPELYCARFGERADRFVYRVLILLEKLCCRLADHVIATNQSYKTVEMQRGHVPEERITVVRNGPDLRRMRKLKTAPDLRQEGKKVISYVGRMGYQDGVDYLLRALHHLIHDLGRSDFFCVLVGAGDAWLSLQSLTEQLDLAAHVRFTGWVQPPQVPRYLSAADICLAPEPSNPYNDCSTAIKLMEYMAFAKPTVAFDLPEHRFTAQGAAVYARPNDELDFARQVAALMDDPKRREEMGQIGRRRIEMELAWSHQERRLLEAYETLSARLSGRRSVFFRRGHA